MKKLFPVALSIALLAGTVVFIPRANAQTPGLVSSIFSRMDRQKRSLKSLRANISMHKYNSQLRDTDVYQGIVLYIPGAGAGGSAFVRLEWSKPLSEILTVANGNYDLYKPRQNVVYRGKTGGIKGKDNDVLALMNMSTAQLRARFGELEDLREDTLAGGVWTQHFKATPKFAASYKYIEVWVDKEGMPVQTKMVEKNDDSTTMRLTNVQKNSSIPMDQFKQNLGSNVKVVKG
jgi:Outer membrane lipoprotein carrier protein LolA